MGYDYISSLKEVEGDLSEWRFDALVWEFYVSW
jgi:hypothetical protein